MKLQYKGNNMQENSLNKDDSKLNCYLLTLWKAILLGNGMVIILVELIANTFVNSSNLGTIAPFDATSCLLAKYMGIIIASLIDMLAWEEECVHFLVWSLVFF